MAHAAGGDAREHKAGVDPFQEQPSAADPPVSSAPRGRNQGRRVQDRQPVAAAAPAQEAKERDGPEPLPEDRKELALMMDPSSIGNSIWVFSLQLQTKTNGQCLPEGNNFWRFNIKTAHANLDVRPIERDLRAQFDKVWNLPTFQVWNAAGTATIADALNWVDQTRKAVGKEGIPLSVQITVHRTTFVNLCQLMRWKSLRKEGPGVWEKNVALAEEAREMHAICAYYSNVV